jgi:hypothetical protein
VRLPRQPNLSETELRQLRQEVDRFFDDTVQALALAWVGGSLVRQPVQPGRGRFSTHQSPETGAKGERKMMQQYRSNSYLFGGNAPYVEELYEAYLDNPGSVPDNWRTYFDNLQHVPATDGSETATWPMRRWSRASPSAPRPTPSR